MIDIKTLTIGSHVLLDGKRVKVCGITRKKVGYHANGKPCEHLRYARLNEVEPILVTPELMEELGFKERRREYLYGSPDVWYIDREAVQLEKENDLVVSKTTFFPLEKTGYADWWTIKVIVDEKPMMVGEYTCRYLHEAEAFLALHGVELIKE